MSPSIPDLVERHWNDDIVPALEDYIRIPALSPAFDAGWDGTGAIEQAVSLLVDWARRRRIAGRLSLAWPGLGHFYAGRIVYGLFWASLLPLSVALVLSLWRGVTPGHAFLLAEAGLIWYLAWLDALGEFANPVSDSTDHPRPIVTHGHNSRAIRRDQVTGR